MAAQLACLMRPAAPCCALHGSCICQRCTALRVCSSVRVCVCPLSSPSTHFQVEESLAEEEMHHQQWLLDHLSQHCKNCFFHSALLLPGSCCPPLQGLQILPLSGAPVASWGLSEPSCLLLALLGCPGVGGFLLRLKSLQPKRALDKHRRSSCACGHGGA